MARAAVAFWAGACEFKYLDQVSGRMVWIDQTRL
jgi:hypothetical protein